MINTFKIITLWLLLLPICVWAQPGNYWSNSFNTESSLLSGAVVGGNAGITAIFYNPAGISDITESRFDLNASLFNLEHKTYENPLGADTYMDNYIFTVFPRFTSYLFQSKKFKNVTYQFAIFNRNSAKTEIYTKVSDPNSNLIFLNDTEEYTGLFDLTSQYDDYWGSMGFSKRINDHWSVGASVNISIQAINYYRSAKANVFPTGLDSSSNNLLFSSNWNSNEKIKAYNWRAIGKLGVIYRKNNWHFGANITLPSLLLFGNADVNKTISQNNIFYNNARIPDYYLNEYPQYVYFEIKDPFSIAVGWSYVAQKSNSEYYITMEYFAPIKEYLFIDPKRKASSETTFGTDFSAYKIANKQIFNIALGYKKMFNEKLGFLVGVRTDFNPFIMGYNEKYWESNSFEALNIDLYHLTGGIKFNYRKSSFIVGVQQSIGYEKGQEEFINFSEPVSYDPETKLALQGKRSNDMMYFYASVGFYFGFSIAF